MSKEYPCVYFDHEKCTLHGTEPEYIDWCVMGPCGSETPSNGDHVRGMTDEKLAKWHTRFVRDVLSEVWLDDEYEIDQNFAADMLRWLKQPYKEEV